jgi:integrase
MAVKSRGSELARSAVRELARFAESAGWPADRAVLARREVIEAFCAHGLAGRSPASRGTYRSALREWAGLADGGRARRGPGYPGTPAPAPYTRIERAELMAIASAQQPSRRSSALAMIAAGLGAGLTAAELMGLRGVDVADVADGVVVSVTGGRRARVVPVTAPYDATLTELGSAAGQRWLFRPGAVDRGYKNAVCNLAETLVRDPAAPSFRLGRARASFICDRMAAGTGVLQLLEITGIVEAGSLARYAVHVDQAPITKGAWQARWRAELTR